MSTRYRSVYSVKETSARIVLILLSFAINVRMAYATNVVTCHGAAAANNSSVKIAYSHATAVKKQTVLGAGNLENVCTKNVTKYTAWIALI